MAARFASPDVGAGGECVEVQLRLSDAAHRLYVAHPRLFPRPPIAVRATSPRACGN
jgi:hypothetical protein